MKDRTGEVTQEYRLDGSKIQGKEQDGTPTVEWIDIKGRQLIIRSSLKAGSGALKDVPIVKTQKWGLSEYLETVTISEQFQLPEGMHVCPASTGNGESVPPLRIAERTYEERTEALPRRGEGSHLEAASVGQGAGLGSV